ncbi:hypothetical protein [Sandarakinorhabdus sp.]|uniref:hypothetical protein n=1 Tax=Sandarakinorhabdus sp. TaxID=1916663 RepID=UPI00286E64D5|nr:hypothetical protein [Sandarakinorhabdus sp.]
MTKAIDTLSTTVPVPATPIAESGMIYAFRVWVSALKYCEAPNLPEGELDARTPLIGLAEEAVFRAPVETFEDMAALAWVSLHRLGLGGFPGDPASISRIDDFSGEDPHPFAGVVVRLCPRVAAIMTGRHHLLT